MKSIKKKCLAAAFGVVMAISLAACGGGSSSSTASSSASSQSSSSQEEETQAAAQPGTSSGSSQTADTGSSQSTSGGSKSLIVYFDYSENMGDTSSMSPDAITSASLDGSSYDGITENDLLVMRDEIQNKTDADVFSVRVTDPYNPDYNTMVGVAQEDQNDNKQFSFVDPLPDLSAYDTIYMGMPVWWGGLPQPMVCLLDQYDFSGKTIIPFGINLGSGFGDMIDQIKEAEPNATVVENGLTENAHTSNLQVIEDVDEWLSQI